MMLNGDFNPADDCVRDAGHESSPIACMHWEGFNPSRDVVCRALIPELFREDGDLLCIAGLDGANEKLWSQRSGGMVHAIHVLTQVD